MTRCVICGCTDPAYSPRAVDGEPACWQDDELCAPCAEHLIPDLVAAATDAQILLSRSGGPGVAPVLQRLERALANNEKAEAQSQRSLERFEAARDPNRRSST